jgi:hypothetical protein
MRHGVIAAALAIAAVSACTRDSVVVLPPDFRLDSMGAPEYSAEWWKWARSSPRNINPVRDLSGANCSVGQTGHVWFLAGGFGSAKIRRFCTIPEGQYLFFPAVNMVYWPSRSNTQYTCEEAIASAGVNNDSALEIFVEVDNFAVDDPKSYRARTSICFDIFERVPPEVGAYNAFPSASDGYWYMLEPLPKGEHIIKFGGRYDSPNPNEPHGKTVQDIEYTITVE